MAMISGGDESARNAFRAYLRDDSSQLSIVSGEEMTEEMSARDVLEVKNLADAIERAERALRESSRPRDMFAELGTPLPIPLSELTDDTSGPAVYKAPILTPVPPPLATTPASTQRLPVLMVPTTEEDAFMQPGGRMRHFAEETLDGYRPESTMQLRIGARRKTFTIVVGAIVGVLAIALGAGVVVACMPASTKVETKPVVVVPEQSKVAPVANDPPKKSDVPTLNVNDLPSAR